MKKKIGYLLLALGLSLYVSPVPQQVQAAEMKECKLSINPKTNKWAKKTGIKDGYRDLLNQNPNTNEEIQDCLEGQEGFERKMMTFTWVLVVFASASAFLSIVHSGMKYITSGGDDRAVEEAKKQLWYTAVGVFLVLSAVTITNMMAGAL